MGTFLPPVQFQILILNREFFKDMFDASLRTVGFKGIASVTGTAIGVASYWVNESAEHKSKESLA